MQRLPSRGIGVRGLPFTSGKDSVRRRISHCHLRPERGYSRLTPTSGLRRIWLRRSWPRRRTKRRMPGSFPAIRAFAAGRCVTRNCVRITCCACSGEGRPSSTMLSCMSACDAVVKRLRQPLMHHPVLKLEDALSRMDRYSSASAEKIVSSGRRVSFLTGIGHGLYSFFRIYILRAAFIDGAEGFLLAVANAEGSYYRYMKAWLANRQRAEPSQQLLPPRPAARQAAPESVPRDR